MRTVHVALLLLASFFLATAQAVDAPTLEVRRGGIPISNGGSDYQPFAVGTTVLTYVLQNTGSMALGVTTPVTITNVSGGLTVDVTTPPGNPVAAGGNTNLVLTLTVAATVTQWSFNISVANTDVMNTPYTWRVRSGALQPDIKVEHVRADIVDGGTITVGDATFYTYTDYRFTVRNVGVAPLIISNINLSSPGLAIAPTLGSAAPPLTVNPAAQTTIIVRMVADRSLDWSLVVSITSNDADENPFDFTMQGKREQDFFQEIRVEVVNEQVIADGGTYIVPVGSEVGAAIAYSFRITNVALVSGGLGGGNLTVGPVTIGTAANATATVTTQPNSPVAAGGNFTTFIVEVEPTLGGTWSVPLSFVNNDTDGESPFNFAITGVARGEPDMEVSKGGDGPYDTNHAFNTAVSANGYPNVHTLTIRNTGAGPLILAQPTANVLTNCTVVGTPTLSSSTVAPGGTATYTIRTTPTATGMWSCVLNFVSNDPTPQPFQVTLSGNAAAAAPEMALFYGSTAVADSMASTVNVTTSFFGKANAINLRVQNLGTGPLNIDALTAAEFTGQINCTVAPTTAFSVNASESSPSGTLVLRVTPGVEGPWSVNVAIPNNDADEDPYNFVLTGVAKKQKPQDDCGLGSGFSLLLLLLVGAALPLARRRR